MIGNVTAKQLAKAMFVLDANAVRRYAVMLLDKSGLEFETTCLDRVQLGLADWLIHLGVISDAQVVSILKAFATELRKYAERLEQANVKRAPVFTLVICDGTWASCSGRSKFFNFDVCEDEDKLPVAAVTHIMCDVTAMFFRLDHRLNQLQKTRESRRDSDPDEPSAETAREVTD